MISNFRSVIVHIKMRRMVDVLGHCFSSTDFVPVCTYEHDVIIHYYPNPNPKPNNEKGTKFGPRVPNPNTKVTDIRKGWISAALVLCLALLDSALYLNQFKKNRTPEHPPIIASIENTNKEVIIYFRAICGSLIL